MSSLPTTCSLDFVRIGPDHSVCRLCSSILIPSPWALQASLHMASQPSSEQGRYTIPGFGASDYVSKLNLYTGLHASQPR